MMVFCILLVSSEKFVLVNVGFIMFWLMIRFGVMKLVKLMICLLIIIGFFVFVVIVKMIRNSRVVIVGVYIVWRWILKKCCIFLI